MYDINKNSLKQILTLRYDTTLTSALPELRWEDYKRKDKSSNILSFIEESIVKSIHNDQNNLKSAAISLSSGIDSTLIATIIKKYFPDLEINSLSITFSDSFDESPFAKKIADRLDINHHVVFIDNFLEELPKAIKITQKPFWDLHWYHIAKEAKKYSKNFFSGDGGDELFGGYTFRYKKYLSLVSSRSSVKERIQAYLSCHERDWVPEQEKIFTSKLDFRWEQIFPILEKFFHNDLDLIEQVFLADYNGKLRHNMEPLYKKFHKFFDMSYLAPMLNESLIRFSTNLPHNLKYNPETNQGKIPLVELCKKYSMYDLISKEKKGFSVDTNNMWKNYGQKTCQYFLDDGRIIKDGWIKDDWIKNNISRSDLDVRYINKFLGLLAFEIWYRLFVTNEMKENEKLKF